MRIDKDKLLMNLTQGSIWLSIQSARLGAQISELTSHGMLMGGYGIDSLFRFYQDFHQKKQQEKLLVKLYQRGQQDITWEKSKDFARIQALLAKQKKLIQKSLAVQQKNLMQLEQVNYARLTAELSSNIAKYKSFLWQYHIFANSGLASGLTLDLLYLLFDYGIAPLGSHITLCFCMLNQIKCWAVDINEYMDTLAQCERKINCLINLNFNADLQKNNELLIQNGLAPLFNVANKGEYLMRELNIIAQEQKSAKSKIITHSFWYAFMLTGMACLFFCANPIIGFGVFGSGFVTYAVLKYLQPEPKVQALPLASPFVKIVQRAREFCDTPIQSRERVLAF